MTAELHQPSLGRAIVKRALAFGRVVQPGVGRHRAIHRGDIDHAGIACRRDALFQGGQRGPNRLESSGDAAGIGAGKIIFCQGGEWLHRHGDGSVHKNIQAGQAGEETAQRRRIAGVKSGALHRKALAAKFPLIIGQRRIVAAIDDDMGAGPRQCGGHGPSQMAACRRNKCDAVLKAEKRLGIHGASTPSSGPGASAQDRRRNLTLHGKQALTAEFRSSYAATQQNGLHAATCETGIRHIKVANKPILTSSGALSARQAMPP